MEAVFANHFDVSDHSKKNLEKGCMKSWDMESKIQRSYKDWKKKQYSHPWKIRRGEEGEGY